MENKSSITALMSAFGRAYHAENAKNPIFADSKARGLLNDEEYKMISSYILGGIDFFAPEKKGAFANEDEALRYLVNTQISPTPLARARFCEDSLETAMKTGTEQYVILGAGMDTFAFRKPEFAKKYKIFEVDHPLTQADKKERIRRAGWELPKNLRFVPMDFEKDDLKEELLKAGFDSAKKTFFSWLGVSYYISLEEIEKMLDCLAAISSEGSTLLFDCGNESLLSSSVKRVQNMLAMAAAGGEPMKSCFSYAELEKLLEKHSFLIYEFLNSNEIQDRYFADRSDELTAFEHICYVSACYK